MKLCWLVILSAMINVSVAAETQPSDALRAAWQSQLETLESVVNGVVDYVPEGIEPQSREELFKFLHSSIAMAYFGVMHADSEYPDFWPALNQVFNLGWPNPDDAYYYVPIDDDGVYRISGTRGSVRIMDFQISAGLAAKDGTGIWGPAQVNYDADDLNIDKYGRFDVVLSAERPEGYKGDWWKLDKNANWIMARQRSYDWTKEEDGRYGIERLDVPAQKPRYSEQQLAERLKRIAVWAETWVKLSLRYAQASYKRGEVNAFELMDFGDDGGFTGAVQKYPKAVFLLQADEALIVETEIPKQCRYWNFQLVDTFWRTIGGHNNLNSLNGHQATLDKDGKFRFVVSAKDPGVANWLDNTGYETGFVYGRWNRCSSAPLPKTQKVKLSEVGKYLPKDTLVITPAARDKQLRERRLAAQMRRRW